MNMSGSNKADVCPEYTPLDPKTPLASAFVPFAAQESNSDVREENTQTEALTVRLAAFLNATFNTQDGGSRIAIAFVSKGVDFFLYVGTPLYWWFSLRVILKGHPNR